MEAIVQLTRRVFNSPLIKFANFEDGKRNINLVRLIKPYANGDAYVIHECTKDGMMFKTLEQAETKFDSMVASMKQYHKMTSGGRTSNYELPKPSASVSPAPRAFLHKASYQYAIGKVNGDIFYCASPRFEGTACIAVLKGGTLVARYKTEYDMLAGVNAYGHYAAARAIDSLGMLMDEMEDEPHLLESPH